jgi:PAS domain S-box-containing protein
MSVRKKIFIIICVTFLVLLGILFFTSRWFVYQDANVADEKSATRDTTRLLASLDNEIAGLDATLSDWAPWDDTYEFITNGDPGYIKSNLPNNSAYTNIGVELMLFINNSGQIVFGKMVDLESGAEIPIPKSLSSELGAGSRLLNFKDPTDKVDGILNLPDGAMIVAAQPILTSQGQGTIRGTLIMGRRFNQAEISKLSKTTQLSISSFPYIGAALPGDVALARNALVGATSIFVAPRSAAIDSGYALLKDIHGNPALILRVDTQREAFTQAKMSLFYLGLALLSIGLILGLVTMLLLEKIVIVRLTGLNSNVMKIGSQGSAHSRVEVSGNDEIHKLGTSVNGMLDSLENSLLKERETQLLFRTLFELSPDAILLIDPHDPDGSWPIIDCNAAACQMNGYARDELIGQPIDIVNADPYIRTERSNYLNTLRETGHRKYEVLHRHKNGTVFSAEVSTTIIQVGERELLIGIDRDITDRKQADQALARQTEELRRRNEELDRLYRASGSLLSGASLGPRELAKTIIGVVEREFGQVNCGLLVISKESNELQQLALAGQDIGEMNYQGLVLDGPGLVTRAIRTNKLINVGNVHSDPDYIQGWDAAQSELIIPLRVENKIIGAIDIQSPKLEAFSPDDERLMSIFAERAALVLEHSRLNAQTETHIQQLLALRTIDMAISGSFDINMTLSILLDQVRRLLGVHAADILAFNSATQSFNLSSERGFHMHMLKQMQIKYGAGYAWRVVRERQMVVVADIRAEADGLQRVPDLSAEQFISYVGIPLLAKGQVKGVLEVFHREPLVLAAEWYAFLEMLAGQAAIAIDNAELFDHLESSNAELGLAYDSTLEGWASALELRDKETEGHTRRVTELTLRLAQALGVNKNELVQIYRGALLHDIGKMGVPDSIVLKPGPLTEEEWVIMRKHPQYAYDMLLPISYLRQALDIPYCHHEKWDGTGYPRSLKGGQIPLAARVFSVVDVWDALTSDRPYRKAWKAKKAKEYIYAQAGKQFDPKVVETFLREILSS